MLQNFTLMLLKLNPQQRVALKISGLYEMVGREAVVKRNQLRIPACIVPQAIHIKLQLIKLKCCWQLHATEIISLNRNMEASHS